MSDRDGGAVVQKFFEAMNDHDLDQVISVASEDIEFVDVAAGEEIYVVNNGGVTAEGI